MKQCLNSLPEYFFFVAESTLEFEKSKNMRIWQWRSEDRTEIIRIIGRKRGTMRGERGLQDLRGE